MARHSFATILVSLALLAGGATLALTSESTPAEKILTLTPKVFPVGKWAEGIAATQQGLWVAESGARAIALLNAKTGETLRRVTVGRLPVGLVAGADDVVSALIQTDRAIWRQPTRGRGKAIAGLPGCPNALAQGAGAGGGLWVLTMPACSSDSAQLVRVDPKSGAQTTSRILGQWGEALAAGAGVVYVAHARPPALDIVDQKTLAVQTVDPQDLSLWAIVAGPDRLIVGGRINSDWSKGVVASLDPKTGAERQRRQVDQMIVALAADEKSVVAVGEKGRLWVLAPNDLTIQKTIDLSTGAFKARAAVLREGVLYVTSQEQFGDKGAVFAISGWR
jgi:hypothetical protein